MGSSIDGWRARAGTRARARARAVNGGQLFRSPSGCSTHATRGGSRGGHRVAPAYVRYLSGWRTRGHADAGEGPRDEWRAATWIAQRVLYARNPGRFAWGASGGPGICGALPLYTLTFPLWKGTYTLSVREKLAACADPDCTFVGLSVSSPELWSKLWWRLTGKVAVSQRF